MTDLRELSLIQTHPNRIHHSQPTIEVRFEVPVRAQCLADVSDPAILRMQLDRFVVFYVVALKEHIPDRSCLLVDFERVTGENDTFGNDPRWIGRKRGAHCD